MIVNRDDERQPDENSRELDTSPIHGTPPAGESPRPAGESADTMASDEPEKIAARESGAGSSVVKICKGCMLSQRDGGNFCVRCGEELVAIQSVRDKTIGEVIGDRYTIVDKIGSGGMGDVYLGLNDPLGQQVAIKFLNEKFTCDENIVLRFLNEARSYCKVNHPNAVTLLEYGQHDDGSLYLITEFIDGQGLTEVVQNNGPLLTETVVSVGVQVCEVLAAAHGQGIIHRDLKPDNLMMIPGSRGQYAVKVLDFGIAKIADEDVDGPMTETGSVFGTPEFMSPEQARGETADPRSDLYSLGVILYFMATGSLPFSGKNKFSTLNQQLNDDPVPPSEVVDGLVVHPELERIAMRCLEKAPDDRPSDADEVADALESIDCSASEQRRPSTKPSLRKKKKKAAVDEPVFDGPAADDRDVKPLGASTFDDDTTKSVDISFDADVDPMAVTVDSSFEDETDADGDARWAGVLDTSRSMADSSLFSSPKTAEGRRIRSAVVGVLATLVVVGGVVVWTGDGTDDAPADVETVVDAASGSLWHARASAAVGAADRLVESGDFSGVDLLLARVDEEELTTADRSRYDEIVDRASRARNTKMQLRSAIESKACDEASSLFDRLGALSPRTAEDYDKLIDDCGDDAAAAAVVADAKATDSSDDADDRPTSGSSSDDGGQTEEYAAQRPAPTPQQPPATEQPVDDDPEPVAETGDDDSGDEPAEVAESDAPSQAQEAAVADESDDTDHQGATDDEAELAVGDGGTSDDGASPGSVSASTDEEPMDSEESGDSEVADEEPDEVDDAVAETTDDESEKPADGDTSVATESDDDPEDPEIATGDDERDGGEAAAADDVALPPSEI